MFRFLRRSGRQYPPDGQPAPPPQHVTVRMADGQLAHGQVVEQRADGEGTNGPFHPTIVMVGQPAGPLATAAAATVVPSRPALGAVDRPASSSSGLFFRRIVAWAVLAVLSAGLHLFSANVHLPHVSFGWPWSSTTTNTLVGPLVLEKIEGIDKPALGTATFDFSFTRKVTKNLGILAVLVLGDVLRGRAARRPRST